MTAALGTERAELIEDVGYRYFALGAAEAHGDLVAVCGAESYGAVVGVGEFACGKTNDADMPIG